MKVSNLGVKISKLIKPIVKEITMKNLLGKKIAIDAFNSIFQFLATIRQPNGIPLQDYEGNVTSHLSGLFYRTLNLLENDIKPLYVFDGPPHELKLKEIYKRREIRDQQKKAMEEAQDEEDEKEAMKHAQASSKLTSVMIQESKELLSYMGVPCVEATHDGEGEAARLINDNIVWASSSQDYDSLLFGAKRLVRNLNINRKKKVKNTTVTLNIEYYTIDTVLDHLKLTHDQLIDVGILVGLDFFDGIKGIGEKTAYKLIKEHTSIENIISNKVEIRKKPIEIDSDLLDQVRNIFKIVEPPKEDFKPKWKFPDESKIRELLIEKHNFGEDRLNVSIKRLIKKKSSKQQISLDKFLKF